MYLMKVNISYYEANNREALKLTTLEQWKGVAAEIMSGDDQTERMAERLFTEAHSSGYFSFDEVVTVECLAKLTDMGLRVDVRRVKGLFSGLDTSDVPALLAHTNRAKPEVHIHVPGSVSLTSINEVDYMEDACTNALQEYLNKGWRIIAVCPPNDSRRPTYILGRTK